MDRQQQLESILNFSMDEADMSYSFMETQKSLRQQFKRLKVNSSTQASMSLVEPSTAQQSDYQISLLNFNIDMDSTLNGPISSISVCNADKLNTVSNSTNSRKRQRPLKDDNHSMHSDTSFSTNFGLSFNSVKGFCRLPLCHTERTREEELHQLRVLVENNHLKLLNLQMELTRIQIENEVKLFNKKIKIHEMELKILRLNKYKG